MQLYILIVLLFFPGHLEKDFLIGASNTQFSFNFHAIQKAAKELTGCDILKIDHSKWDNLLKEYVNDDGKVDYSGLKKEMSTLDAYLQELSNTKVDDLGSRGAEMAFYINAYNAFTIKLILDNYPLESIMSLDDGKVWDRKWVSLDGKKVSLNYIENEILRPQYQDPRIHFAVNCAAISCPPLANQAFTSDNLDALLDMRSKSFINNAQYNQIKTQSAAVSRIFDWYGSDFGKLIEFLNQYSSTKIQKGANITFNEYDWGLNG